MCYPAESVERAVDKVGRMRGAPVDR